MRTVANIAIAAALVACRGDAEPLERLPAPVGASPSMTPELPPPPPPPPPPRPPGPRPPPAAIMKALRGRECVPSVTIYELEAGVPGGRRVMGHRERNHHAVDERRAIELVARLQRDESFTDGDVGCTSSERTGYRIECAGTVLDIVEDCTRLYLTDLGHRGEWVLASEALADFLHAL